MTNTTASRKAVLIINPRAGQKAGLPTNRATPDQACAALEEAGLQVEIQPTESAGHASELASEAARAGVELVVAAGGDGTVHEVACGLIGTSTVLGVLPMGSVMNIARSLNIPRDLRRAAAVIGAGTIVQMDVGRATTRTASEFFLEAAGAGVDAGIARYANRIDAGDWSALLPMIRYSMRYVPRRARIVMDGRSAVVRAHMITVAIAPFTGPAMALAPEAQVDDGQFDVVIRAGFTGLELLRHALSIVGGRRETHPKLRTVRARRVEIGPTRHHLQVHADGRDLGLVPAQFEIVPGALRVLAAAAPAGEPSAVASL